MIGTSATFTGPQHYNDCLGPLYFDAYAADLVQRLPKKLSGNVLEIACGTGIVSKRLREHLDSSIKLVATDLSKAMLDYAHANYFQTPVFATRVSKSRRSPLKGPTRTAWLPA